MELNLLPQDLNVFARTMESVINIVHHATPEHFVQSFKTGMKTATGDIQITLCKFLMHYRSSPHAVTGKTPAEVLFSRNIRTRLDLLHPTPDDRTDKGATDELKTRQLKVGDLVWSRNYRNNVKWLPGKITKKYGPRNYQVQIGDQTHKRHIDQLRGRQAKLETEEEEVRPDDFILFPASSTSSAEDTERARYPQRNRRPPNRLTY